MKGCSDDWKALIQASLPGRYMDITQSTIGVVFVGTPHKGSSHANLGDIVQGIGEAVLPGYSPNRAVIKSLKKNCDALFQSANTFGNICGEIRIFSFFETVGTVVSFTFHCVAQPTERTW